MFSYTTFFFNCNLVNSPCLKVVFISGPQNTLTCWVIQVSYWIKHSKLLLYIRVFYLGPTICFGQYHCVVPEKKQQDVFANFCFQLSCHVLFTSCWSSTVCKAIKRCLRYITLLQQMVNFWSALHSLKCSCMHFLGRIIYIFYKFCQYYYILVIKYIIINIRSNPFFDVILQVSEEQFRTIIVMH